MQKCESLRVYHTHMHVSTVLCMCDTTTDTICMIINMQMHLHIKYADFGFCIHLGAYGLCCKERKLKRKKEGSKINSRPQQSEHGSNLTVSQHL